MRRLARWRMVALVLCLWIPAYGITAVAMPVCGMAQSAGSVPGSSAPPCCEGCPFAVTTAGCSLCGVTPIDQWALGFRDRVAPVPLSQPIPSYSADDPEPPLPPPIVP